MSDEFDNNDDLEFDWDDSDGDDETSDKPKNLGFTGDLTWRGGSDDDNGDDDSADDDLAFDWDEDAADDDDDDDAPARDLGFTGLLSWRQDTVDPDDDLSNNDEDWLSEPGDEPDAGFTPAEDDIPEQPTPQDTSSSLFDEDDANDLFGDLQDDDAETIANREQSGITGMLFGDDDDDSDEQADPNREQSGITGMLFGGDTDDLTDRAADEEFDALFGDEGTLEDFLEEDEPEEPERIAMDQSDLDALFGDDDDEDAIFAGLEEEEEEEEEEEKDLDPDAMADMWATSQLTDPDVEDEAYAFDDADDNLPDTNTFLESFDEEELDEDEYAFDEDELAQRFGSNVLEDDSLFEGLDDDEDFPEQPQPTPDQPAQEEYSLDALLESYAEVDDTDILAGEEVLTGGMGGDDDLFDDFEDGTQPQRLEDDDMSGEARELLEGVRIGEEEASATALIRQRENKAEDELDDRLYNLRQRAQEVQENRTPDEEDDEVVPGVIGGVAAAAIDFQQTDVSEGVELNREQRNELETLREMVASDEVVVRERQSAVGAAADDVDLAAEFFDPTDEANQEEERAQRRRERRRRAARRGVGRWAERLIIAAVLVAAVLGAYFGFLLFGEPPAENFDQNNDGAAAAAFTNIDQNITPRSYALFAVEYGPNSAAELDGILRSTLTHTIANGGFPIIIGRNPIGISRVEEIMRDLANNEALLEATNREPLEFNEDYFIIGFLPGGESGLRNLVADPATTLANNIQGGPTNLPPITSLDSLALITVLADTPDDVRFWAEQVAPSTSTPLIAGVARVADVLARQYYVAPDGFEGLLVGQPDANIYNNLLTDIVLQQAIVLAEVPTSTPVPPTATPTLTPIGYVPSPTPEGFVPSETPEGYVPTLVFGIGAFVTTDGAAINVREAPDTNSSVVAALAPGTSVRVQGETEDNEWTRVIFREGVEGWVSTALIRAANPEEIDAEQTAIALLQPTNTPTTTPTPTNTPTPTPTETSTPTSTPTATATEEGATEAPTDDAPTDEPLTAQAGEGQGIGEIIGGEVTVRGEPSSDADEVTTLNAGDEVPVRGLIPADNGVMYVEIVLPDGSLGYVPQTDINITTFPGDAEPTEAPTEVAAEPTEAEAEATERPTNTPIPTRTPAPTPTPTPALLDEGTVVQTSTRTSINARSGPGTEFDRVAILRPGTRLEVIGNNEDGTWVEVRLPEGDTGFVFRGLAIIDPDGTPPTLVPTSTEPPTRTPTETTTPTATPVPLDTEGLVAVITSRRVVNVRSGPGRGFQSLGPVETDEVFNVLSTSEDQQWIEIQLPDGRTGFVIVAATNVIPGESYARFATATAEAGGEALLPPDGAAASPFPTIAPDETSTQVFVPGRAQYPLGTSARVRGIDPVNLRPEPSIFTPAITTLRGRERVEALARSADERWIFVRRTSGEQGWVSRPLVAISLPQTPTPTETTTPIPSVTPTQPLADSAAQDEPTATPAPAEDDSEASDEAAAGRRVFSRVGAPAYRVRAFQQAGETGVVIGDGVVQVRELAGLLFDSVGTAEPGDTVTVIGPAPDTPGWLEVRLEDGTEGFVQAERLDLNGESTPDDSDDPPPPDDPETEVVEGSGTVSADDVPVLAAPDTDAEVITTLEAGTEVGVLPLAEENGNFVEVRLDEATTGFVEFGQVTITNFPRLAPVTQEDTTGRGTVSADNTVNIRQGPSMAFGVVGEAEPGDELAVLALTETEDEGEWAQVELPDGETGFLQIDLIAITDFGFLVDTTEEPTTTEEQPTAAPTEEETTVSTEGTALVTATGTVNVRQGPSLAFSVVGTTEPDDQLPVLELTETEGEGEWARVRLPDDTLGFVSLDVLEVISEPGTQVVAATETPAAPPAEDAPEGRGEITAGGTIDVRAAPSTEGEVVGAAASGDSLPVLAIEETEDEGQWVQVRLPDDTLGFVQADQISISDFGFIVFEEPEATEEPDFVQSGDGVGTINANAAINVRAGASADTNAIAAGDPDQTVAVLEVVETEDEGEWAKIRLPDGTEGWVASFLLNIEREPGVTVAQAEDPTPTPSEAAGVAEGSPTPSPNVVGADATETPTPTPSETQPSTGLGVVNATSTVNIRQGPGLGFGVIGEAEPGDELTVLGLQEGDDETWVQVELPDGTTGSIQSDLIVITVFPQQDEVVEATATPGEAVAEASPTTDDVAIAAIATSTEAATSTPASTATPTPTPTPTLEPTTVALLPDGRRPVFGPFYAQDAGQAVLTAERQELAVRIGLIVSALLIGFGNLFYAIFQRRK